MEIVKRRIDYRLDVDEDVEVKLRVPDDFAYDSLRRGDVRDVSAYVIFSFERGDDVVNYNFVSDSDMDDAEVITEIKCDVCGDMGLPQFKCGVWFRHHSPYGERNICDSCLESFLEIRDDLLEEFSGQIASEKL